MSTETEPTDAEIDARRLERWRRSRWRRSHHADGLLSIENAPVIAERVARMFPEGRRFTLVRSYIGGTHTAIPDVHTGQRRDVRARGRGFTTYLHDGSDGGLAQAGFGVYAEHLRGFGAGTTWKTEREQYDRLHREHKAWWDGLTEQEHQQRYGQQWADRHGIGTRWWEEVTHIDIEGGLDPDGPEGPGERLVITYTNSNGVSQRTIAAPEYISREEQAERERATLDVAAAIIERDQTASAARDVAIDLRDIGARNVYHGTTLGRWSGPVDEKARKDADWQREWDGREDQW